MKHFGDILFRGAVEREQTRRGSRAAYAKMTAQPPPAALSDREAEFIAARDSFYIASVSEDGWPYVQHRGGPAGFLKMLDGTTLAFGDYRGNKQYVSTGHFRENNRAALFLMDYPNRRRLKALTTVEVCDVGENADLAARVSMDGEGKVERIFKLHVEAFDWNCPQFITPRYTADELQELPAPQRKELERLKNENVELKRRLTAIGA